MSALGQRRLFRHVRIKSALRGRADLIRRDSNLDRLCAETRGPAQKWAGPFAFIRRRRGALALRATPNTNAAIGAARATFSERDAFCLAASRCIAPTVIEIAARAGGIGTAAVLECQEVGALPATFCLSPLPGDFPRWIVVGVRPGAAFRIGYSTPAIAGLASRLR